MLSQLSSHTRALLLPSLENSGGQLEWNLRSLLLLPGMTWGSVHTAAEKHTALLVPVAFDNDSS